MKVSNLLIDIREFSIAVNVPLVNVVERMQNLDSPTFRQDS